ncbi:hypothetical protein ACXYMO_01115 [Arenibacterium sp. CAU 1754]
MKLFSVSIGLIIAALGIFYVPVSFAVDGFGLVVNPGGVRTVRAVEPGTVLHFPSQGGRFLPGQIVSAVTYADSVAENILLEGTMYRELAKIEADHLEKTSKVQVDYDRDRAKQIATSERLAARTKLMQETDQVIASLQSFTSESVTDIDALNQERLAQLARLEDLVKRSGEVSALPAQRLATMLEEIQSSRLSVITSKGATFSTDKMILDMIKGQNDLIYSNSIDQAEIGILEKRLRNLDQQIRDLETLRQSQRAEAEASFLAKSVLPQVAVANEISVDMRTLQASRADVAKGDALRLLATDAPIASVSFVIYGAPATGRIALRHGTRDIELSLPVDRDQVRAAFEQVGVDVAEVRRDAQTVGAIDVISLFVELAALPDDRISVVSSEARNARGLPILVAADISLPNRFGEPNETGTKNEIIGFLENRHAVVLQPGQPVRGTISDTRTGAEIVFDARLLERDYATVDTKELGIRLGNQSLAAKIIKRGVLSQVVIGVDTADAVQIEQLPGAVVHLSFPLARQSLFSFLMAKNAPI